MTIGVLIALLFAIFIVATRIEKLNSNVSSLTPDIQEAIANEALAMIGKSGFPFEFDGSKLTGALSFLFLGSSLDYLSECK